LPDDFERWLNATDDGNSTKLPVVETGAGTTSLLGPNGVDRIDIYVGMRFDGCKTFDNFTSSLPDFQFKFYRPPTIQALGDILEFYPQSRAAIDIHVSQLTM
jgi:hypothetical protein